MRKENSTRWEVLEILTVVVVVSTKEEVSYVYSKRLGS